ncbi:hypothetical protein ADUPG1_008078 [Aduncisulcus paluster]|uniref:Uncharacterized protein n=1 Tax=Aduncisulcus paluster TaxID=2918883 RepID=A0ABQ5KQM8_9EUKA|nr:hypothetical protein ADUPG1_008078 [Aduncisulcus paluster]
MEDAFADFYSLFSVVSDRCASLSKSSKTYLDVQLQDTRIKNCFKYSDFDSFIIKDSVDKAIGYLRTCQTLKRISKAIKDKEYYIERPFTYSGDLSIDFIEEREKVLKETAKAIEDTLSFRFYVSQFASYPLKESLLEEREILLDTLRATVDEAVILITSTLKSNLFIPHSELLSRATMLTQLHPKYLRGNSFFSLRLTALKLYMLTPSIKNAYLKWISSSSPSISSTLESEATLDICLCVQQSLRIEEKSPFIQLCPKYILEKIYGPNYIKYCFTRTRLEVVIDSYPSIVPKLSDSLIKNSSECFLWLSNDTYHFSILPLFCNDPIAPSTLPNAPILSQFSPEFLSSFFSGLFFFLDGSIVMFFNEFLTLREVQREVVGVCNSCLYLLKENGDERKVKLVENVCEYIVHCVSSRRFK